MVKPMPTIVPPLLILQSRTDSHGQPAWRYPAILELVDALATGEYAILGGDVLYEAKDGALDHSQEGMYGGNWYLNRTHDQPWTDYVAQSRLTAQEYIEAYVRRNSRPSGASWFAPVWIDEQGFARLPLREE